jgi:hypothetical protein
MKFDTIGWRSDFNSNERMLSEVSTKLRNRILKIQPDLNGTFKKCGGGTGTE